MHSGDPIEHTGIIRKIDGTKIQVSFSVQSACSSCHAKGVCSAAGMEDKSVDVIDSGNFVTGEKVKVILKKSLGYKALLLGYVLPFLILLFALMLFTVLLDNELLAGIYSLFLLLPYYLILYFYRGQIRKKFSFVIQKLD
jgi:sigma-E factor negative regulatory protein RseC